ncbi:hypothetical protein [Aeoliella sp. SH292]|uniref:hypothetical protein n=1 Tax=Aeoliella sp. SH292 TaxID=3454464 RepID=UPI003F964530
MKLDLNAELRWVGAIRHKETLAPRPSLGRGRGSSIQLYRQNLRNPLQTTCRRWQQPSVGGGVST